MVTSFDLVILTFRNVAFLLFLIFSTKTYCTLEKKSEMRVENWFTLFFLDITNCQTSMLNVL